MPENLNILSPVILIFGSDDFLVKSRSREIFNQWRKQNASVDEEIIDGAVDSQEEALKTISKIIQALNTLPFFGSMRIIWFKDCNFLSDKSRTSSERIWKGIDELAKTIKQIKWTDVRLLISADEVDKRRVIFKTISEVGRTEYYEALSIQDPEWEVRRLITFANINTK
jgi:DNA polymerase-3 subunit delta